MVKTLKILLLVFAAGHAFSQAELFQSPDGIVHFKSTAPLEIIEARSNELNGIIDLKEGTTSSRTRTARY